LDGDAYKRIRIGTCGNQQLGCRCVVKEAGRRLIRDGEIGRDERHASWSVVVAPFDDPLEEVAQHTEPVLDGVAMQWATVGGGPLGKPALVCLEVAAQQIGRTSDGWVFGDDE